MSATFLNIYEIRSYGDLVQKVREMKQEIKKKIGRKNRWESKLMELKDYGKFAIRLHRPKHQTTASREPSVSLHDNNV